ncbi:uncharacterized protein BX663DRAFT_483832 [Cokeromyces recurvatus]|uniref:uncharacterized protein n=1 Tax=Cokeromyces recurvatus TaxID=90255 RepID=UPI00221E7828|nr:uncharacterized protein BX663DRAFT_483832 [Cokeromyces recurvatus]KAI7906211.1 hypothetical protein BX663DRAFT_483832 [Cokeromyces recurvatus]
MGNSHSRVLHHYQRDKSIIQFKRKSSVKKVDVSSRTTSPGLSRSSSISLSRPTSIIGDVKDCVQKFLSKSSTLDISTQTISSLRSMSTTPAEMFSVMECDDDVKSCSKYCLPIDEKEQDRLTNTHYVIKHCFGGNFSAPVNDLLLGLSSMTISDNSNSVSSLSSLSIKNCWTNASTRVLDVACGSGVWVLEMATTFPHTQFYGIDIAPIYPNSIKPPNTHFQQCDILDPEGLPFPDAYFDYVHMRLVYNCFSKSDLKIVLSEINRVLKPGGYIELRDIDPIIKNPGPITDDIFSQFSDRMNQLYSVDTTWTQHISDLLLNEGEFTDVYQQMISIGFGLKSPLATSINSSITDAIKSYKSFFMEAYSLSSTECDETIDCIIEEISTFHSYLNYYSGWARKPLVFERLFTSNNKMDLITPVTTITDIDTSVPITPPSIYITSMNNLVISDSPTNSSHTLNPDMIENAFDIVHLTHGFVE